MKYKRLKICKYSFEISKVIILSLSTGLAFISTLLDVLILYTLCIMNIQCIQYIV